MYSTHSRFNVPNGKPNVSPISWQRGQIDTHTGSDSVFSRLAMVTKTGRSASVLDRRLFVPFQLWPGKPEAWETLAFPSNLSAELPLQLPERGPKPYSSPQATYFHWCTKLLISEIKPPHKQMFLVDQTTNLKQSSVSCEFIALILPWVRMRDDTRVIIQGPSCMGHVTHQCHYEWLATTWFDWKKAVFNLDIKNIYFRLSYERDAKYKCHGIYQRQRERERSLP